MFPDGEDTQKYSEVDYPDRTVSYNRAKLVEIYRASSGRKRYLLLHSGMENKAVQQQNQIETMFHS